MEKIYRKISAPLLSLAVDLRGYEFRLNKLLNIIELYLVCMAIAVLFMITMRYALKIYKHWKAHDFRTFTIRKFDIFTAIVIIAYLLLYYLSFITVKIHFLH